MPWISPGTPPFPITPPKQNIEGNSPVDRGPLGQVYVRGLVDRGFNPGKTHPKNPWKIVYAALAALKPTSLLQSFRKADFSLLMMRKFFSSHFRKSQEQKYLRGGLVACLSENVSSPED